MKAFGHLLILLGILGCPAPRPADSVSPGPLSGQVWLTAEQVAVGQIRVESVARRALHGTVALGGQVAPATEALPKGAASFLADLPEAQYSEVRAGAAVTLRLVTYADRTFEGKVDWVANELDPTARAAKLGCTVFGAEGLLKAGMSGTVTVWTRSEQALAVRASALLKLGTENEVFVENGKSPDGRIRFERREVAVEEAGEDYTKVVSGLREGEGVVTRGGIFLAAQASR
jgi:cobalt-zinc-cadmium efflux system membrane fusion protein